MDGRTERSRLTRDRLITASLDLFEQVGFDETTIDQIAAAAGVSPRTFFHHFGTKETVLFSGYADRLTSATAIFRTSAPSTSLAVALEAAATSVVEAIGAQPDLFLRRSRLQQQVPSLRATMLRINEEWIDSMAGVIDEIVEPATVTADTRLVAAIANSAMRTAIDRWVATDGTDDLARLACHAFDIVRPAIDDFERRHRSTPVVDRAG